MEVIAAKPTEARPGSAEKLEVMRLRVAAGRSCFHPDDNQIIWKSVTLKSDTVSLKELYDIAIENLHDYADEGEEK
jgi:hypothetical protein